MTDEASPPYRPGDVVNGHMLSSENEWVPVGSGTSSLPSFPSEPGPVPVVYAMSDHGQGSDLAPRLAISFGVGSFIVGVIPCIGFIALVPAGVAIIFGVIGLRRGKSEHKVASIIGLVFGAIGLALGLAWAFIALASFGAIGSDTY